MKEKYLYDKKFLKALDLEPYKEQYTRITVLDFTTEQPLASLEGKCTSGSINLNGSSNVRRVASCSVAVDFNGISMVGYSQPVQYYNITEVENLISINKKVKLEVGFTNTLQEVEDWSAYSKYETIWFPQGVYIIKAASISKNNSGVNISLTLNDKMALLNGDVGGVIPAATNFSEEEVFSSDGMSKETKKILIKDIIRNIVSEFGGESLDNIIITDVPDTARKVIKWVGDNNVYFIEDSGKKQLIETKPDSGTPKIYTYGQDIGYTIEDFTYPGDLECNAGDTVVTVLDKIKNTLGNYEFFYDIEGHFVFQEIKNYIYNNPAKGILEISESDYMMAANLSTSVYDFDKDSASLIMSISSSPQFPNIKNDFIVWGVAKTSTGANKPIRYRLAFENKPTTVGAEHFMLVYTDYRGLRVALPLKEGSNFVIGTSNMENHSTYYYDSTADKDDKKVWHWDDENEIFRTYPGYEVCYLKSSDWRTELYYQGLEAADEVYAKKPYSAELNSEWPKIVNIKSGESIGSKDGYPVYTDTFWADNNPSGYEYWLDFIENSKFKVENIGRRTKVISDDSVNCIFSTELPTYMYAVADGDVSFERDNVAEGYELIQVSERVYDNIATGGSQNSAFDTIKELMYVYTSYNETINLTTVPIYYLEPNARITICDLDVGINDNYLVKTISLPLAPNGTSNISATKIIEKTF